MPKLFPNTLLIGILPVAIGGLLWKGGVFSPFSAPATPSVVIDPPVEAAEPPASLASTPAIKVVKLLDKSGSREGDRNATPTAEQLQPLADALVQHGGELAIGDVCSDSNQVLSRLRLDKPSVLDQDDLHNPTPPPPAPDDLNAFEKPKAKKEHDTLTAMYEAKKAEDDAARAKHDAEVAAHRQEAAATAERYLKKVQPLLESPATCPETDLNGVLARAMTLLNESPASWRQPPSRFLLVVSDGLDTIGNPAVTVEDDVTVLVVGPQTNDSVFQEIDHLAFESLEAAIAHIISIAEES